MNNKEFAKYKKQLKGQSPLKKISSALTAATERIKGPMEMRKKIAEFRKKRAEVAAKMKKN